jgi:hypothetical protein
LSDRRGRKLAAFRYREWSSESKRNLVDFAIRRNVGDHRLRHGNLYRAECGAESGYSDHHRNLSRRFFGDGFGSRDDCGE